MFPLNVVAAAAAGGSRLTYRIRAVKTLPAGGFDTSGGAPPVPAGWSWVRGLTGRYQFTHDLNPATAGIAFLDTARTTTAAAGISVQRTTGQTWNVVTQNAVLNGSVLDVAVWVYAIEPLEEGAVQLAEVNGTTGAFVGTAPAGWTIARTAVGTYRLQVSGITDYSFQTGGHALFCTPLANQSGARVIQQTFSATQFTIIGNTVSTGAVADTNFYIALLRADSNLIQGVQTLAAGGTTGANPGGFTNSKTAVGLYTMNPNKGESIDPRIGDWVPWMFGLSGAAGGMVLSMVPSGNNASVDTHLASTGAAADKDYGFQLLKNALEEGPPVEPTHTLFAVASGITIGFINVQGITPVGSFTPANSGGWPVGRLTYGGSANAVTFSFRGNRANDNNSWVSIEVTGLFENGQATKILQRTAASFNGYNATTDETAWGLPEFTDSFVNGRTYQVIIRNRTPG